MREKLRLRDELRVFIGYDSKEPAAYHVLSHSILRRASRPISITPIALDSIRDVYSRPRGATETTEFSLTRFLVPYLSGYDGHSVFMDCDMLVRCDIWDALIYPMAYPDKAVFCVQHDYTPKSDTKFLGQQQTSYPRKNWSSFMLFNNALCKALTPEYVNAASGLELHRFLWLKDEQIGDLPIEWNWLVGEYEPNERAKVLHYTNGGPWFPGYRDCDHAREWFAELGAMNVPQAGVAVKDVLQQHHLTGFRHDVFAETFVADCSCSTWHPAAQPSRKEAEERWSEHVIAALSGQACPEAVGA
jgi:hypothetical protein